MRPRIAYPIASIITLVFLFYFYTQTCSTQRSIAFPPPPHNVFNHDKFNVALDFSDTTSNSHDQPHTSTSDTHSYSRDSAVPSSTVTAPLLSSSSLSPSASTILKPAATGWSNGEQHPIDDLVKKANEEYTTLWGKRSTTIGDAAAEYRQRRGRHPPPEFGRWFEYAQQHGSPVIEEIFDRIHHDLEPFWAVPANDLEQFGQKWPFSISIRDGKARIRIKDIMQSAWLKQWENMLRQIAHFLPDVDLGFNELDMPRLWVPWEDVNHAMQVANATKQTDALTKDRPVISEFRKLPKPPAEVTPSSPRPWPNKTPIWDLARRTCPPGSEGRTMEQLKPFDTPIKFPEGFPNGSYRGYIANWTYSKSFCDNGHFANMHGALVKGRSRSANDTLQPLFGGCKFQGVNNDILVPPAYYWIENEEFGSIEKTVPWEDQKDKIVWRGQASGGAHNKDNWTRFHRPRFVGMMNGTLVTQHMATPDRPDKVPGGDPQLPHNIPLPETDLYDLKTFSGSRSELEVSLNNVSDVGFVHYLCDPWLYTQFMKGDKCAYMEDYYQIKDQVTMSDQFKNKYLPDIDGSSYSGRFRAFLLSGSLPMKATLFAEWHDSRLLAWRHFVPMDLTGKDWWGILEYFMGDRNFAEPIEKRTMPGHDEVAKALATQGRDWARQIHRKEDMLVYMYRLVLEFARLCDERREQMGYVEDLR